MKRAKGSQDRSQDGGGIQTAADYLRHTPRRKARLESLSAETYGTFLRYIEAGAYDHIAATSLGISNKTFYAWLRKGRDYADLLEAVESGELVEEALEVAKEALQSNGRNGELYLMFLQDVEQAKGKARLLAEMTVGKADPKWWLSHGYAKHDWTPNLEVQVEGRLESHVEHAGQIDLGFPASDETVVGALAIFQELGLIQATAEGLEVFPGLSVQSSIPATSEDGGDGKP